MFHHQKVFLPRAQITIGFCTRKEGVPLVWHIDMMGVGRTLLPLSDDAEISIRGAGRGPADQQSLHQLTAPQRVWERSHVEVWRVNNATDHVCNDASYCVGAYSERHSTANRKIYLHRNGSRLMNKLHCNSARNNKANSPKTCKR